MPDFVDGTIAGIDGRLAELKAEESKLMAARAALLGQSRGAPGGSAPRARTDADWSSTGTPAWSAQ